MRRTLRHHPVFAALMCASFLVQSTGAADLAPAFARGMIPPPPGRMAPLPLRGPAVPVKRTVKPAGEPWLVSASVVARWVAERVGESLAKPVTVEPGPSAEELAAYASAARNELAAVASLPAPEPPLDRMLIAMEGRHLLAAGLEAQLASIRLARRSLKPLRPRFIGDWVGRGDVRARVDYLKPLGLTRGEAKGFRVRLSDGYQRLLPNRAKIPESLMKELPLYFAGDSVELEVTVRNDGPRTLTDVAVASVQEAHTASGEAGAPLGPTVLKRLASLAPGEAAVLRWRVKLAADGPEAVNFEQTHLRVLSRDPAGGEKVELDETQAGIVDPPGAD